MSSSSNNLSHLFLFFSVHSFLVLFSSHVSLLFTSRPVQSLLHSTPVIVFHSSPSAFSIHLPFLNMSSSPAIPSSPCTFSDIIPFSPCPPLLSPLFSCLSACHYLIIALPVSPSPAPHFPVNTSSSRHSNHSGIRLALLGTPRPFLQVVSDVIVSEK